MRIGIIGAGYIGRAVARLATKTGFEVMLSNSRDPKTLASTATQTGAQVGWAGDAAAFGDLLLLAVPFHALTDIDPAPFTGKVLMDANNYYPHRDGVVAELEDRSQTTSGMTARHFPQTAVVKAFNAILEWDIETTGQPAGAPGRRALPIAGDDAAAKKHVAAFHDRLGFDVVDVGPLREGWRFERARPAYCVPLDSSALQEALQQADTLVPEGSWRA